MRRVRKGVSLVEMLITLALLTLLALLVVPQVTFLHTMILRAEVEQLYAVCSYLRRKALATGQEQVLLFDKQKNSYSYDNSVHTLPKQVCFGYLSKASGPPATATQVLHAPITFQESRIVFYPTGIIQSGTVYLTDIKKRWMYALAVPVSQVSFVRVYRYDKEWISVNC